MKARKNTSGNVNRQETAIHGITAPRWAPAAVSEPPAKKNKTAKTEPKIMRPASWTVETVGARNKTTGAIAAWASSKRANP